MEQTNISPDSVQCFKCKKQIDASDNYCRYCGMGQGAHVTWYYRHAGIIVLTFFLMGPLALFYVWRSPVLSRNAKIVYTIVNLFYTYMIYLAIQHTANQMFGALDAINEQSM